MEAGPLEKGLLRPLLTVSLVQVIDARVQLYDDSLEEEILSGKLDFVLDCIDTIQRESITDPQPEERHLCPTCPLSCELHLMVTTKRGLRDDIQNLSGTLAR
ncbi:hypothetical protein MKW98_006154 [Papaver atlanticum]|uniref:Uncharacterized protein n=1 Tax=Papaver atlanticum TaxID=357466 RepID=A0AAD4XWR9_9MAGN|nr:hypothetical protein MKW98_006154 [Papaver atlanticum]